MLTQRPHTRLLTLDGTLPDRGAQETEKHDPMPRCDSATLLHVPRMNAIFGSTVGARDLFGWHNCLALQSDTVHGVLMHRPRGVHHSLPALGLCQKSCFVLVFLS